MELEKAPNSLFFSRNRNNGYYAEDYKLELNKGGLYMCGSKYMGTVLNQGYHLEDTYPKTDKKVGRAELEEIYRAEQIETACKIKLDKERRRFKGY